MATYMFEHSWESFITLLLSTKFLPQKENMLGQKNVYFLQEGDEKAISNLPQVVN